MGDRLERRATDEIIREMHGLMLQSVADIATIKAKVEAHESWDTAQHMEDKHAIASFHQRLIPIETFRDRCSFAGNVVGVILIYVLPAIGIISGGVLWLIRHIPK